MGEPAARAVLALLTDFGTRDPYVAAMKGAALSVCPDATLVDLTHDIAPHDVAEAARHLAAAAPYFPAGTAFVVVVDPGVGTARRALAARAGGHWFVGPDNGVLTPVLAPDAAIVEITSPRYMRETVSATFEGRDRFAPAAAWLLRGVPLAALGPLVTDPVRLDLPRAAVDGGVLRGVLVGADRFGNVATSIDRAAFEAFAGGARVRVSVAGRSLRLVGTYAEIGDGEVAALFGSAGLLEIAARSAPALGRDGVQLDAPIEVVRQPEPDTLAP
jgi:S-adenosyl-L-methionine hydrolase (adenosine-forming)